MSTRSNNPDLHGPLPPASRPRRSKSAGGTGQPPQADHNPKETSASLSRESDGGDIGRERLDHGDHGSSHQSKHRDHTNSPKGLGTDDSTSRESLRCDGLGSPSISTHSNNLFTIKYSVRVLSKEEKIQLLTKEHILLWKRCEALRPSGATEELRALLGQAQESQKTLQKLIPRTELEEYVRGWNPWTIKKEMFPTTRKEGGGKKRSSSSQASSSKNTLFNDPGRWKRVMRGCNTLEAAYRHMAD
ncbi:hypothetical protein PGT21_018079 [Puccinia graminis f. sp. tritici]|uniref:Uncharacterized protein n=1 Tax=Puccinia graminis f. sp. tritici TaxID=56615 RepID=A0A5B0MJF7_PUCGR|nr:hypothetical protein PGT21_018079 [Puccinia graminis f. sp. tritici]